MPRRWPLLLGVFAGLAALAAALCTAADPVEGWRHAARWTARAGYPLFLAAYCASALGRLWPDGPGRALWRDRRWWGLGFAAAHTVHLYALVTFTRMAGRAVSPVTLIGGGLGYLLLYLMVITSSTAAMRLLGRGWRRLHRLGMHWLWAVFALSYAGRMFRPESMITGLAGTALAMGALTLRIAAAQERRLVL